MSQPITTSIYTASCNPPRRARPRLDLIPDEATDEIPVDEIYDDSTDEEANSSPEPPAPAAGPRKRGRKPSTVSRSAREAQRKLYHSVIEKARRTKINEALAHLRRLVPDEYKHRRINGDELDDEEDGDYGKQKKRKGQPGKEKEFKLDILVRTVAFVEDLLDKVKTLEARDRCQCEGGPTQLGKRKHPDELPNTPQLPPISSWMPTYLPSPPSSTHFQPTTALQMPPTLSLDPSSPRLLRTPDEEVAASLLLRMSGSEKELQKDKHRTGRSAHTPASLLGMTLTGR